MKDKGSRQSRVITLFWIIELALLVFSVLLASRLRFMTDPETYLEFSEFAALRALVVAVCITIAMASFGLYQAHVRHNWLDLALRLILSFSFGGIALSVLYYIAPATYIGRGVLIIALLIGFVVVALSRLALGSLFQMDAFRRRVLVLGAGNNADLINVRLRREADRRSFNVVGFVPIQGQQVHVQDNVLVDTSLNLPEIASWLQAHEIVIAADERRGALPMEQLLVCAQRGIKITDLSTFFERESGVVTLSIADPSWLVFTGEFDHSMMRALTKRSFDLVSAMALLFLAWPVMLLVAAAIYLESGGPVFYRQSRVGKDGRTFDLEKFRSMRNDAESDGVARWATQQDDRVTRVGRFIRATRLDELPQLFNILRGEMSFVGPRPERPQFVETLNEKIRYYSVRHCMKPGLTGWAQLRYPYGASVDEAAEKLKFDLFYVKNHGLLFDMMIMLQTVEVVMFRRGAR